MGYLMDMMDSQFTIKAANKAAALKAIRALARVEATKGSALQQSNGQMVHHFSWVDGEYVHAKKLEVALDDWRYEATVNDETKDIVGLTFCGEKLGDDEFLFKTLAPFVEDGSYVQFSGEDGAVWRWSFIGGKLVDKSPRWDNDE